MVELRGRLRGGGSFERSAYVVCGASAQDVEDQVKWHIDISQFDEFSIRRISRIKPFHRLWSRIETSEEYENRKEAKRLIKNRENDDSRELLQVFAIGITGYMNALTEEHASRKLGHYFFNRCTTSNTRMPFIKGAQIVIEPQGESDETNTNSADRIGALNLEGRPFSGGLPSLGKSGR